MVGRWKEGRKGVGRARERGEGRERGKGEKRKMGETGRTDPES